MKRGCGQNKNGGVDEEREQQGDGGISRGVTNGHGFASVVARIVARLHNGGVQI